MRIVDWKDQLTKLYRSVQPTWTHDVNAILEQFSGYEEALWLALCGRFGVDPSSIEYTEVPSRTPIMQFRFKAMRIYSRYCPAKLSEIDSVVSLAEKSGEHSVLSRLTIKYGPEPQGDYSVRERVVMWFAFYDEMEQAMSSDKLVAAFEGHSEALFERLTNDLGPEPRLDACVDPREPRARLVRFFLSHEPHLLTKVDYLLMRYADDTVRMFGVLQRRHGREPPLTDPTKKSQRTIAAQPRLDEAAKNIVQLLHDAEREAKQREMLSAKAGEIVDAATTAHLTALRSGFQRHPSLLNVRRMVAEDDTYSEAQILQSTEAVFTAYCRMLVPCAAALIKRRFGVVKEATEWLSFLDFLFANELPHSDEVTLRQVVSLLDIQLGDRLGEVVAAGGVEAFVHGIASSAHKDWIRYLTSAHGTPNEHDIGIRNRHISHYLFYNPSKTIRDAEMFLQRAQRLYPLVEEALTATYGDEPPAPPVNLDRVQDVLRRYAPHRLPFVEDVIEAHCLPRDRPDDVIRRICRTYGAELTSAYPIFEALLFDECEGRFQIFSAETRMREIFARRFATAVDSATDIYEVIEQRAAKEASMKLELQLQRIRKQQEELQQMKRAKVAAAEEEHSLVFQGVIKEEEIHRLRLHEEESEAIEEAETFAASVLDLWDESLNIELAEMLKRHRIYDTCMIELAPMLEHMEYEHKNLEAFLSRREIWRRKWLEDERQRDAAIERMIVDRQEAADQKSRQMQDALLVSSAFSEAREHELLMKERFEVLNEQAMHVLKYNAELHRKRLEVRAEGKRVAAKLVGHRGLHARCRFSDPNYEVTFEPLRLPTNVVVSPESLERIVPDSQELFLNQVVEYLSALFEKYEPARLGSEASLMQQYKGKEAQLILGLEQKYNIHHWIERQTRDKLLLYLRKMAPHLVDNVDVILKRFAGQEEAMWRYLTQSYGPPPQLQSNDMRLYLKNRLVRYLTVHAPHLLLDADMMVDRCDDNGDALFQKLTREFGPEGKEVVRDALERKLRTFYKRRGMTKSLAATANVATRFVGQEELLHRLMMEKFGESFTVEAPDTDELLL